MLLLLLTLGIDLAMAATYLTGYEHGRDIFKIVPNISRKLGSEVNGKEKETGSQKAQVR